MRFQAIFLVVSLLLVQALQADDSIFVRAKRQQCRCIRNPGGGLTCSCAKGTSGADQQQSQDLASELSQTQHGQSRCVCIQVVFQGNPQYQCQCGDQTPTNGPNQQITTQFTVTTTTPLPTTTTMTTTTPLPMTTTTQQYVPTVTQSPGQCQCIMIRISGPSSAQYQCQCQNTQTPAANPTYPPQTMPPGTLAPVTLPPTTTTTTTTPPPPPQATVPSTMPTIFPPVGTINSTEQGCFCVDPYTNVIQPQCSCSCNCLTLLVSEPNAVCGCPQDSNGALLQQSPTTAPNTFEQVYTTPPTFAPTPPPTVAPTAPSSAVYADSSMTAAPAADPSQYPMTTTCVMYVGVPTTPCMCLPQYDQCAQNVCCLKAKYRSHKRVDYQTAVQQSEPTTIDMLMSVLQKLKTKFDSR